jgi:REP element-mobilizing transposase RayT
MARKARKETTSTLLSITQRSHQQLFRNDEDRKMMLEILKQAQATFDYECFAYCLLDEHIFKLILDTKGRSISTIMASILMSYSSYRQAEGKLFSGRYISKELKSEKELEDEIELIHQKTNSQYNSFCFHCQEAKRPEEFKIKLDLHNLEIKQIDSSLNVEEAKLKLESWMRQKGCDPLEMKKNKSMRNQCIHEFRKTSNCSLKTLGLLFEISESSVSKILSTK